MRIFFKEMVLYHPSIVVAAPIGDLELRQRIVIELVLSLGLPSSRQLQLVEDTEFHWSPRICPSTAAAACSYSKFRKVDKVERFFHGGHTKALVNFNSPSPLLCVRRETFCCGLYCRMLSPRKGAAIGPR